ncbi:hypothetical protein NP233_g8898 [Leucocoprinus birnbaumii]|uniref:Uncharacterized protein n=1 Tax=Leucocoprinus birnbaumii TaxID=56174 RepID=A0AAD5VN56_9AGAR|nr:hypothetical protein NP233_g8898 [Leucocoprinus birnbaumii]
MGYTSTSRAVGRCPEWLLHSERYHRDDRSTSRRKPGKARPSGFRSSTKKIGEILRHVANASAGQIFEWSPLRHHSIQPVDDGEGAFLVEYQDVAFRAFRSATTTDFRFVFISVAKIRICVHGSSDATTLGYLVSVPHGSYPSVYTGVLPPVVMPNQIYSTFPKVSHNLSQFTRRACLLCKPSTAGAFLKFTLSGEYTETSDSAHETSDSDDNRDRTFQAVINVTENQVRRGDLLSISRDYDSAIGIADTILVDAPMTVWAVPHRKYALKTSIHLKHSITYRNVRHQVPYHHIPNFELGNFANRHQVYVLFPRLWNPDLGKSKEPYSISERNRALWYASGMRPAIESLLGHRIASDWPASLHTEKARAQKTFGGVPGWTQKIIPGDYVAELAQAIREAIEGDPFLTDEDVAWAKDFFFVHSVRGVKHGYYHGVNQVAAQHFLDDFIRDCRLVNDAHLLGTWWIDVGIEISSDVGNCVQWATGRHRDVLQQALFIPDEDADRLSLLSSSKYSRDLASHLSAVSGFRVEPGSARGPMDAVYIQAYTTDKAVVYNPEGSHHAKFLTTSEALSQDQPCKTIEGLYDIYEQAKGANSSNARLEVRVPWRYATDALMQFDARVISSSLYIFTPEEWWDFRLIRMTAISQILHLQSMGRTRLRFLHDALTLTAACVWLLNGLHARPDDGPASRDLMDAAMPLVEACDSNDLQLAYRVSLDDDNHALVAHIPFGCVFFRRMNTDGVPRLRVSGLVLPGKSFKFWFHGRDRDQVQKKYQTAGIIDRSVIELNRSTMSKRTLTFPYINRTGKPEPDLFNVSRDVKLPPPVYDDGSDIDVEQPELPEFDQKPLDARLSFLWRQFVSDVTSKSPSPRNAHRAVISQDYKRSAPLRKRKNIQNHSSRQDLSLCLLQTCIAGGVEGKFRLYVPTSWISNVLVDPELSELSVLQNLDELFGWSWMPKAGADRMWLTSVAKPGKASFIRWPEPDSRSPAPLILLHAGDPPVFGRADSEDEEHEASVIHTPVHLRHEEEEEEEGSE